MSKVTDYYTVHMRLGPSLVNAFIRVLQKNGTRRTSIEKVCVIEFMGVAHMT